MRQFYKFSCLLFSLLFINLVTVTESVKADNPNIQLLGPVVNGDPWPFDYPCGSTVSFAIEDVFEIYIDVTNDDYTCPITLDYFLNPPTASVLFDPPLPMTGSPGATLKTHLIFASNTETHFTLKLRARDCHDTSYCYLDFDWVLPVELTSFVSVIYKNDVTLKWITASETNNERFEIERSSGNSQQWNKVGTVPGFGNSSTPVSYSFNDNGLNAGNYNYRLKQIDFNGNSEFHNLNTEVVIGIPGNFDLSQNYPNPFNPVTQIDFQIPDAGIVNLSIYDNSGKLVSVLTDGFKPAGYYKALFNASDLSSGVYYYRLKSDNFSQVKKMMLIK